MIQFKLFLLVSTFMSSVFARIDLCSSRVSRNHFEDNPAESYVGQSSYATSYEPNYDYPAFGNFGNLLNMKNPQITSSYTTYGASENNEFGSTNYINYPSSVQTIIQPEIKSPIFSEYSHVTSHNPSVSSPIHHHLNAQPSTSNEEVPISQHIEVTRPVIVPVYKKFPYAVPKHIPVAIPHPVLVPVPQPFPVNVLVSEPVAVPVIREIKVPVEKEVMYPVPKNVPVQIEKPMKVHIEKHYPVYVPRPYPVKIPVVKTLIHKAPKKWSREEDEENRRRQKIQKTLKLQPVKILSKTHQSSVKL
ncbi:hypothetical protein PVAND_012879 [Polypedilum vanderplanki]|uniref:Uncharacterized protein n=1 Tax=Polypedilum vanderplanki TaxID=319348 RepID=A0A9J6CPT7_POLVA|nr:hypothetical protein PVAND_012879 [Polypedilum vanderplanki]